MIDLRTRSYKHIELKKKAVVFTTTFSLQYNQVVRIVKRYLPILSADERMKSILDTPVKFVAKKALTLGSMVSPSLFRSRITQRDTWLSTVGFH